MISTNKSAGGEFTVGPLPTLNLAAQAACQKRLDCLTKPPGSLGLLEQLALKLSAIRGFPPRADKAHVLVFAADHGVTDEGVSAFPKTVTAQMAANFLRGGAAINVFARQQNAKVSVVDVGVDGDLSGLSGLVHAKVRRGTRNLAREDAMTQDEVQQALHAGREQAARVIAEGAEIVCLGEMGIGNTTSAAALISALLPLDPALSVGRGTGVDSAGLARKQSVVRMALERAQSRGTQDPVETLAALGGLEIAALCGVCLASAARRTPVLVDGYISSAAALCAIRIAPAVQPFLFFGHRSAEAGHIHLLNALSAPPLLQCEMRLGEGTGAVLALPLLRAACAMLTEMATFESAGVSNKTE